MAGYCGSESVEPAFSGAHSDDRLHGHDPDFPVTDTAGLGCFSDNSDKIIYVFVVADNFHSYFWHKVYLVLGAPVHLGVPALSAISARFTDCHAMDAECLQRCLDIVEFEWLDDSRDELHVTTLSFTTFDNALRAFPASSRNVSGR